MVIGSVVTNGDVEIIGFPFDHLEVPLIYLRESGVKFYRGDNSLIVRGGKCYPFDISNRHISWDKFRHAASVCNNGILCSR